MKFRISIVLILLGIFVSSGQAQTSNCCDIQVGAVQITNGGEFSIPPDGSGPGGVYFSSITETEAISCFNAQTEKACQVGSTPNNVVTATGAGANVSGSFVACDPTFLGTTVHASVSSGTAASFKNQGVGYASVNTTTGNCVQQNPQPFAISSCLVVACTTTTGGGQPPCCLDPVRLRSCTGCLNSPIVLDISGKGFILTNAQNGVKFDISGAGTPIQIGWTAQGSDNAFLALPGADGLVHNGQQLFGNYTPQPQTALPPNGFAALAVYDDPQNGGNNDGIIDARDAIFASLRLWIDANHDGISQVEEMHTLPSLGVNSISLKYKEDDRTDQYGNVLRYHAQVNPGHATTSGRIAYDVFFVTPDQIKGAARCQVPDEKIGMLAVKPAALR